MALVDMFLKLDGVNGESADPDHKKEIQIDGFRLHGEREFSHPYESGFGETGGGFQLSHMTIRAKVDKSTPKLFENLATGRPIHAVAVLTCRKAGKEAFDFFKVTLSEVRVVRVDVGNLEASGGDVVPPCELELSYGKIAMQAWEQTSGGTTSGPIMWNWSLMDNK